MNAPQTLRYRRARSRSGMYFTLDAMFAAFLIVGALVLVLSQNTYESDTRALEVSAQDAITILNTVRVEEFADTALVADVLATGQVNETDRALYAIGILWATNNSLAQDLTQALFETFAPGVNYGVYLEGDELYVSAATPQSSARRVQTFKQPLSGIASGKPLAGSTAAATLQKIENKSTSAFTYFGGFVGQGNITVQLFLPTDVDATRVKSLTLELDTPQEFTLTINGDTCGTFSVSTPSMVPDAWNLDSCIPSLVAGANDITIEYDDLGEAYIAGGYLKATFRTNTFVSTSELNKTTYRFPDINGVVNLYDSFFVPQTLRNLSVYLHYTANDPTAISYLTIGEKIVWSSNETGTVSATLTDVNLTLAGLDYVQLSNATVPIRFSAFNSTVIVLTGGNADVVLVTDYSGSMKKSISSDAQGNQGQVSKCDTVYADNTVRRQILARCLGIEVVSIVSNYTGNRLWPVQFGSPAEDVVSTYTNPTDKTALENYYINGPWPSQGGGDTCIACALSAAYEVFDQYNQTNRSRFVILMTDGLPNRCTASGCGDEIDTTYASTSSCSGYCDGNGQSGCSGGAFLACTDSSCSDPINNAQLVAEKLHDDFNATVYTVAFGPVGACNNATALLQSIAAYTNGTYFTSNDSLKLKEIYVNISTSILEKLTLSSQSVTVPETAIPSQLHGDSFLLATHDSVAQLTPNQIEVKRQSPPFNSCNPTISFPSQVSVLSAEVISYSGIHWTDFIAVNGQEVFNLTNFLVEYGRLGDPFLVNIPRNLITSSNTFTIQTGDSPTNATGCSDNNTLIYDLLVSSSTPRTAVYPNATGCTWLIENDDLTTQTLPVPNAYTGGDTCAYTNALIDYKTDDAYDVATYDLLRSLDYDSDGRIFISLAEQDIEIVVNKVSGVPYLWGPSLLEVRTWQ